jgi:hypothetical protein
MRGFAALVAYVLSITCVSAVLIAALTIIISPVDDSHAPVIQPANAHAAPRSPGKHVQQNQEAKPPHKSHAVARRAKPNIDTVVASKTPLSRTADYWAVRKNGIY